MHGAIGADQEKLPGDGRLDGLRHHLGDRLGGRAAEVRVDLVDVALFAPRLPEAVEVVGW
jgi:hypothetical protein